MSPEKFEALLRAWGRAYGERPEKEADDNKPGPAVHPIAVAMQFGAKRSKGTLSLQRAGQGRRATMAAAARRIGIAMDIVPAGYVDPVPCVETRTMRSSAPTGWAEIPEVLKIERAALDLLGFDRLRGLCLRVAYCTLGTDAEKAEVVSARLGEPIKRKRFRDERNLAKVWVHARIF